MNNYEDKDFKRIYEEVLEDVKTLSTKWNPEVSDESDPGVVLLKAFGLFIDKLNYKINYRNSQNSVENVTDTVEGERLFKELGYQIKKKRSSSGVLKIKNSDSGALEIPLFTEFTNQSGSIVFTAIRTGARIPAGETKLIEVQEGSPYQYTYEGQTEFTSQNLTNNLRLTLMGLEEVSDNGVIIVSSGQNENLVSEWLNIGDNFFSSVETKNIFSVGRDYEGNPYIQFYEESLQELDKGVKIWIISSSGDAGNIPSNRITRILSTLEVGNPDKAIITHNKFTNGSNGENLESAMKNYYDTFGINETIVSERDYEVAIEKELGPELIPLTSKVLVSGLDSQHNYIEILTTLSNGKNTFLTKACANPIVSEIFINALKYSDDYYESFEYLTTEEAERLIKKALFKQKVSSNNLVLIGKESDPQGVTAYDKFIFDVVTPEGVVYVRSAYSVEETRAEVLRVLKETFNSRNLTPGVMIQEQELSNIIVEKVPGVTGASFYYKDRKISKTPRITEESSLTDDDKLDIFKRLILNGNIYPFEKEKTQILPFRTTTGSQTFTKVPDGEGESIQRIVGSFTPTNPNSPYALKDNEIVQFYKKSYKDSQGYGFGTKYRLFAPLYTLPADQNITAETILLAGSIIKTGSVVKKSDLNEQVLPSTDGNDPAKFTSDYIIQNRITLSQDSSYKLTKGTILADGSTLLGKVIYGLSVKDGEECDLAKHGATLLLQATGDVITLGKDSEKKVIRVSGFDLNSTGVYPSGGNKSTLIGDTYLDGSKSITDMEESAYELNSNFYYGVSLDGKTAIEVVKADSDGKYRYMLEDGEFLIYSDENLLDFVSLGSGTLLESDTDFHLTNAISLDSDFSSKLVPLPGKIGIYNTEIETFTGSVVTSGITLNSNKLNHTWAKITGIVTVDDRSFDDSYYLRGSILIKTNEAGVYSLGDGQNLTIWKSGQDPQTTEGTTITGPRVLSFSQPVYLNSSSETNLTSLGLTLTHYELATQEGSGVRLAYDQENGFLFEVSPTDTAGTPVIISTPNNWYLIKLNVVLEDGAELAIKNSNSSVSSVNQEKDKVILLNENFIKGNEFDLLKISKSGTYFALLRKGGVERNLDSLEITFSKISDISKNKLTLMEFTQISGFNQNLEEGRDLSFDLEELSDGGEHYHLKDGFAKKLLLELIKATTNTEGDNSIIPYDYSYETDAPLSLPLEPIKFYRDNHPFNRNVLTVINFDRLEEDNNLIRIIRG